MIHFKQFQTRWIHQDPPRESTRIHHMDPPGSIKWIHQDPSCGCRSTRIHLLDPPGSITWIHQDPLSSSNTWFWNFLIIIPCLSLDYPLIITRLFPYHPKIFPGLSLDNHEIFLDYPLIIPGLSFDYPRIFPGLSRNYP